MSQPIRVLMVIPNLRISNGVTTFAMNYYTRLDPAKVQMDFMIYRNMPSPAYDLITGRGGKVITSPTIKKPLANYQACKKLLREGRYDIVHLNSTFLFYPLMRAARKVKVPVRIIHSHNGKITAKANREGLYKKLLPFLLRQANVRLACSDVAGKGLFGKRDYELLPNVIDLEKYRFSRERRDRIRGEMGSGDRLVIGTVARMNTQKNPGFAMRCFDAIADRHPDAEYWWIGNGGGKDKDPSVFMEGMRHADRVRLLGSRQDVPELYQGMDVLLMPSLFEGLPLVALEAEASGLPCLLSDTITREVDVAGLIRYLPLSSGEAAWADALEELAGQSADRSEAGARMLNTPFSDRQAGENLTALYRRLLEKARS